MKKLGSKENIINKMVIAYELNYHKLTEEKISNANKKYFEIQHNTRGFRLPAISREWSSIYRLYI